MARFQRICIRPPLRPCGFVVPALYVRSRPRWWSAGFDDLLHIRDHAKRGSRSFCLFGDK